MTDETVFGSLILTVVWKKVTWAELEFSMGFSS